MAVKLLPELAFAGRRVALRSGAGRLLLRHDVAWETRWTEDTPAGIRGTEPPAEVLGLTSPSGLREAGSRNNGKPDINEEEGSLRSQPWPVFLRAVERVKVVVYLISASRGPNERDTEALNEFLKGGRGALLPTLVDSDLAGDEQRLEIRQRVGEAVPALQGARWYELAPFDDAGTAQLAASICDHLPPKRRGSFARHLIKPRWVAQKLAELEIKRTARIASGAGAIPMVGLDLMALLPLQLRLIRRIALAYGHEISKAQARDFLGLLGGGFLARQGSKMLLKSFPVLGSLTGAVAGYTTTVAVGKVADHYFQHGMALNEAELKSRFQRLLGKLGEQAKLKQTGS